MRDARVDGLVMYGISSLLAIAVSAWKWSLLCRAAGLAADFRRCFRLYWVGMFFNQLLPTSVGGDVVRAFELSRSEGSRTVAMASVFVERFTGLSALVLLALTGLSMDRRLSGEPAVLCLVLLVALGYAVGTWLVFHPVALDRVSSLLPGRSGERIARKLQDLQHAVHGYARDRRALAVAMALSLVFYSTTIATAWAGCRSFGADVPLSVLVAAVPVMQLLFLLPISLGGVGLQEWAYTVVLAQVGVPPAVGLSIGLLYRAKAIGFGLVGGLLYAARRSGEESVRAALHSPGSG